MRPAIASAMTLILLAVITLCPVIICPAAAAQANPHSCCHNTKTKPVPDCPYSILEKSKANAPATFAKWLMVTPVKTMDAVRPVLFAQRTERGCSIPSATDLYLRNRILLI